MVEKEEKELVAMVTELNMATASTISDWFLDSSATVHVCNDKALFSSYNELETPEEVLMENHDSSKVLGKGTVMMKFTSGQKLTLINVFHVPEIKRNLVSANLMCKRGFKIILESDKVVISKNGVFVGKGYSFDAMFKLNINEIKECSVYIVESSDLWHARLGHLKIVGNFYERENNQIGFEACRYTILSVILFLFETSYPRIQQNLKTFFRNVEKNVPLLFNIL